MAANLPPHGGMYVTPLATKIIGALLSVLTVMAVFVAMAFNRWADAVEAASRDVVNEVSEVRAEIRGELTIQRNRLEDHLKFSTGRVQDYEARLRVLEIESHRHRNGKPDYTKKKTEEP